MLKETIKAVKKAETSKRAPREIGWVIMGAVKERESKKEEKKKRDIYKEKNLTFSSEVKALRANIHYFIKYQLGYIVVPIHDWKSWCALHASRLNGRVESHQLN
jgi:hypothetical protein